MLRPAPDDFVLWLTPHGVVEPVMLDRFPVIGPRLPCADLPGPCRFELPPWFGCCAIGSSQVRVQLTAAVATGPFITITGLAPALRPEVFGIVARTWVAEM